MRTIRDQVVAAAFELRTCRDELKRLKAERGALHCVHETHESADARKCPDCSNAVGCLGPCWKWVHFDGNYAPIGEGRENGWCANCVERETVHAKVQAAAQRHGVLLRKFNRIVRKAMACSGEG